MPMSSKGTYCQGDRFCKDCIADGKYAGELLTERTKLLKRIAEIEKQIEDMGYGEQLSDKSE